MIQLLKIEWLKVKNYKAFWIFLGLYVVALFSINYIVYNFQLDAKKSIPIEFFPYNYPKVWQTISWISSWLLYFPGMLMILLITNEFTYKTHRQNIIDGLSRSQFINVKILVALILAVSTTIVCAINVILFGAIYGYAPSVDGIEFLFYGLVQSLSYILLAMMLAFLLRRSGLAIAIFFLYGLIFEQIIGGAISHYLVKSGFYFLPLETSDALIPPTFFKEMIYKDAPAISTSLIVCACYLGLYIFIMTRKFKKEDL